MPRLWLLATRSWSASPGRSLASLLSVALGVGIVVILGNFYETARLGIEHEVSVHWLGAADVTVHPLGAHFGDLPADLADTLQTVENVKTATPRLKRRVRCYYKSPDAGEDDHGSSERADGIGIDTHRSEAFVSFPGLEGRRIQPGERGAALIERHIASNHSIELGDAIAITNHDNTRHEKLEVIGIFDSTRVGEMQSPYVYLAIEDLQQIVNESNVATAIDIILEESNKERLKEANANVSAHLDEKGLGARTQVETAEFRQTLLGEARRITKLSMMLGAFVAMLSAFFIILTTMSMSIYKRTVSLGVMRCIGMTRGQLAGMLTLELFPLGIAGTVVGVAGGMLVTKMVSAAISYAGVQLQTNLWGIALACGSGLFTTIVTILFLLGHIARVSPLAALRPEAKPPRTRYLVYSGIAGILLIVFHEMIMAGPDHTRWLTFSHAGMGAGSIYLGYILLTPLLVLLLGPLTARIVGPLLGLPRKLAEDQFGRVPWRSTGVCWMLVVGLSLIVYIAVSSESMINIWNFSAQLPEGFIWTREYVERTDMDEALDVSGASNPITMADVDCKLKPVNQRPSLNEALFGNFLNKLTRPVFLACDPESLMRMVKVTFDEGSYDDALAKLSSGGYVLIPRQTAANHELQLDDEVEISINDRTKRMKVAGIVQSPILDMTVSAFQASGVMQFAAANVVIGTNEDLKNKFGLNVASMIMFDLKLASTEPPDVFHRNQIPWDETDWNLVFTEWFPNLPYPVSDLKYDTDTLANWQATDFADPIPPNLELFCDAISHAWDRTTWEWDQISPEERWSIFSQRLLLRTMADELDRPKARVGSLSRLKSRVDRDIRRAAEAATWLPTIVLLVAAIGVGNLMMVSIEIRTRQIAMLRALGAVKSTIMRLVLAEAACLGLVGSICGISLGAHMAYTDNRVSGALLGFDAKTAIPFDKLLIGIVLTLLICLGAGLIPARKAARNDVVTAMQAF